MILLDNVTYGYKRGKNIISNLSLEIPDGTICGLLGRNGVGKSTMLYLISGLLRPQTGVIECNGAIPAKRKVEFLNDIFLVPEEFELPNLVTSEYIGENAPFYPKFSYEDMEKYLALFELDTTVHIGKLSMGQKKKVFLSFAMACNTAVLLLDEPTNGLDIISKRLFRQAIASCMTDEKIIIISTHQVYDVEKILDHVVIAENQKILLNSNMTDISSKLSFSFTSDQHRINSALLALPAPGGANIIEYVAAQDEETEVNLESLFELTQVNPGEIQRLFH